MRTDTNGRRGKKIRKGLGTANRADAERLVGQLNELLRDESLWSLGARPTAEGRGLDDRVIDIFYGEMEPLARSAKALRDQVLPLPDRESGSARQLLVGVPGAGKTSLIRQLMGSHPERDAFPPTSVNRTTTFPAEIIFRAGDEYAAVVTFLSEHETRFEIEEAVSAALVRGATDDLARTAREFLEQSDMRFRLKYILGDYNPTNADEDVDDPYADQDQDATDEEEAPSSVVVQHSVIHEFVTRIWTLARQHRAAVESAHGNIDEMEAEHRSAALDLIQSEAELANDYAAIVSDILEEIRERFSTITVGRFEKNNTGWPRAWRLDVASNERKEFFGALRFFAGIATTRWGRLLTPLVNGIRVAGPFQPTWANKAPNLVLFDTEGLGHKADASADLPDHLVSLFGDVDSIILVHSAKSSMDFSVGKALEALVSAGQTKKISVAFTHMDAVQGPNLRGRAKIDHAFNNLRNIVENQLAKSLPLDVVRSVTDHLERNVFYLGKVNDAEATPAYPELRRLLGRLESAAPRPPQVIGFPRYSTDNLVLSIRDAAEAFRLPWRAKLGLETHPQHHAYAWQSIKAMTRRYAEGFDDGYPLRPASNLLGALSVAISRFLESPTTWEGTLSLEERRDIIDHIKGIASNGLAALSTKRLREKPQPQWQTAYAHRGGGSTFDRRSSIEAIYARWVPIPSSAGDTITQEFLDDIKAIVTAAIDTVRHDVENAQRKAAPVTPSAAPASAHEPTDVRD